MTDPSPISTVIRLGAICAIAAALGGCLQPRFVGHFGDNAFYHTRDHYRVRYLEGTQRLLPEGWTLENFETDDESGAPTFAREEPSAAYVEQHGMSSYAPVRREYAFTTERIDLRYSRSEGVGEIYARTLPLPPGWARAQLSTVMRRAVISIGAPMQQAPDLLGHRVPGGTVVHLRGEGPAEVDGRSAYYVTFDLIRTYENGESQVRRVSLVGLRPEAHRIRVRRWRLPMMVVFGHISAPDAHLEQRPDFESFVSRVDFAPAG